MITIQLSGCIIKAVRADMLKGQATITLETYLDEAMLEAKRSLAVLAVDESPVELQITDNRCAYR